MIRLHDYQNDVILRLSEAWQRHRSVMVQMPTGTGKTHVLAAVVKKFLADHEGSVWIIAHRRELVTQAEEIIEKHGIHRKEGRIRVMSIQWLSRHWEEASDRPSLVIIDEAHHAQAKTYRMLWKECSAAKFLGLTATPCRMNRNGFTELFEALISSWGIAEFIEKGYLSVFDYAAIRANSEEQQLIDSLEKRGTDGDYQTKEMDRVLNRHASIERLYKSVKQFANGKKGIVYAISIDHARSIAEYYSRQGIAAAAIDSKTPDTKRKQLVEKFKAGKIKILVNVDVFSEGFDCPDVEFVQMARPTLSLSKYLQQAGRGLRKSEGKKTCMLIDNVGLYRIFGLPTVAWNWEAMFRGELPGKGIPANRQNGLNLSSLSPETDIQENDMELVVAHEQLLAIIAEQQTQAAGPWWKVPELKAWQDKDTRLWGLRYNQKKTTRPLFATVFDIRHDMAAVRLTHRNCGVVNASGELIWEKGDYLSMRFAKNYFLIVQTTDGKPCYVDLHSLRMYKERPELKRYGDIELLKVGSIYYSRTRNLYINNQELHNDCISIHKFYVSIADYKAPAFCSRQSSCIGGYRWGYACLLYGDYDSFYWICHWLADGSIIVADNSQKYYHATKDRKKEYIGCCNSAENEAIYRIKMEHIIQMAKERQRALKSEKAEKRLRMLDQAPQAVPFRSGMKWGLKAGERIIVPPVYRHVRPPVGKYCAVEKNYQQWGIIALDGTILIEPKYAEVSIEDNGTAQLTCVTGKKVAIKL